MESHNFLLSDFLPLLTLSQTWAPKSLLLQCQRSWSTPLYKLFNSYTCSSRKLRRCSIHFLSKSSTAIECYEAKNYPRPQRKGKTEIDTVKLGIQHSKEIKKIVKLQVQGQSICNKSLCPSFLCCYLLHQELRRKRQKRKRSTDVSHHYGRCSRR